MSEPQPGTMPSDAKVVCAILAAGRASRMGAPKSALALGSSTFIERALAASAAYPTVIVGSRSDGALVASAARFGVRLVSNENPERGMTHSLRLANEALGLPKASLAVLLVDTPLVDSDVLSRVIAAALRTDIAYPVSADGQPGHPVVFGPRARAALDELADGDTLRRLRDDTRFSHAAVAFADRRPFTDVDTQDDFDRIRSGLGV